MRQKSSCSCTEQLISVASVPHEKDAPVHSTLPVGTHFNRPVQKGGVLASLGRPLLLGQIPGFQPHTPHNPPQRDCGIQCRTRLHGECGRLNDQIVFSRTGRGRQRSRQSGGKKQPGAVKSGPLRDSHQAKKREQIRRSTTKERKHYNLIHASEGPQFSESGMTSLSIGTTAFSPSRIRNGPRSRISSGRLRHG